MFRRVLVMVPFEGRSAAGAPGLPSRADGSGFRNHCGTVCHLGQEANVMMRRGNIGREISPGRQRNPPYRLHCKRTDCAWDNPICLLRLGSGLSASSCDVIGSHPGHARLAYQFRLPLRRMPTDRTESTLLPTQLPHVVSVSANTKGYPVWSSHCEQSSCGPICSHRHLQSLPLPRTQTRRSVDRVPLGG